MRRLPVGRHWAGAGTPCVAASPEGGSASLAAPSCPRYRLQQAACALRQAAEQAASSPIPLAALQQQLAALAACAEQLCAALAAAGAAEPPAALRLLQSQAQQLLEGCAADNGVPLLVPSSSQLAALGLQAAAAASAVQQQQAQQAAPPAGDPQQRLRFQQHFMATFADCFAAEVEALQEAEPPIPAGVLLQGVRMAADSEALHPARLRAVVLDASVGRS